MTPEREAEEERVSRIYAEWLRDGKEHDWRAMNEAIIERWSLTALGRVKDMAWRLAR